MPFYARDVKSKLEGMKKAMPALQIVHRSQLQYTIYNQLVAHVTIKYTHIN